ncbi:sugar O-acetyltransferase [Natrarchaeobius chitinivorans]|uniref:Sugar O-acetyltransferase n=1 Tax=Natrarchaeobius chitinivorans TaxID=1679083 RepID=A0A3N6NZR0_NATCH|nr:sugar O-acetyltransferase [Natrarchaeobius chitinivorans]RQG90499.1 sugar O-acetyltransferase [Natrarchaeobius chitinivorans]
MPSEREKMVNGELYDPTDPELLADSKRARELLAEYNRISGAEYERRLDLLDELFGTCAEACWIDPPFRCDYGYNVHVDEGFYANVGCVILDVCRVDIGRNCLFGPSVHVYTASHPLDPADRARGLAYGEPVSIGDDVWIGGRAVLNPGVTIGDGSVVASGAVVTDDVPEGVVVGGNPAGVVKELETG